MLPINKQAKQCPLTLYQSKTLPSMPGDTERGQRSFFKQIFMPYVPVYDKTRKEIISMSAGKSLDMTDTNHGHNIRN